MYDAIPRHDHMQIVNESAQPIPERALWAVFLDEKVADAKGRVVAGGRSDRTWCYPCHFDNLYCGCRTLLADNVKVSGFNPEKGYIWIGARRHDISLQSTALFPDGHKYYRGLRARCPNAHTIQQCAKNWLASKDCDELCFEYDLDAKAYRRQAGVI